MKCVKCGEKIEFRYIEERNEKMRERRMCFTDTFWAECLERDQTEDYIPIISEKFHHYIPGLEDDSPKGARGFGGAKVLIKFNSGIEVMSTNLWHQGEIPERWRGEDGFRPNATLEWQ